MLQKFTTFLMIGGICTLDLVNLNTEPIFAQTAPDTCIQGYVWREATPTDRVCVTPEIRTQTAEDNSAAASRIDPLDRTYGPFTCVQGYVWREATPNDLVCVTPATRSQAKSDNQQASSRRSRVLVTPRDSIPSRDIRTPILGIKRTKVPPKPKPYQFLGTSNQSYAMARLNALDNARKYLVGQSASYGDRNLALNNIEIKKDEGIYRNNKWVSWVIIEIISTNYYPEINCPQPVNTPGGEQLGTSCSPLPTACYFKDPRNCKRRK
jgi:hypothetical protein